jgi:streptomycin 3"-adenylyltransferase
VRLVRQVLGDAAIGAYLHGSAVAGGLRPSSDLDILVVSERSTTVPERRALIGGLLSMSGRHAIGGPDRSVELSVVVRSDVRPWRYPPALELQYGDWWRAEFERGEEPWRTPNPDLAVLLEAARQVAVPLFGPPLGEILTEVPFADLSRAMLDAMPALLEDLEPDTRNVLLTLARIWSTMATGQIRSKDAAATWALARLPEEHGAVLARARSAYLEAEDWESWSELMPDVRAHAQLVLREIEVCGRTARPNAQEKR